MQNLKIISLKGSPTAIACSRCARGERSWDRIAGKPYCPECQEAVVLGQTDPVIERAERNRCAVCKHIGTVEYLTFPLECSSLLQMDLCPEHLRSLIARRLCPYAFQQLRRRLAGLGLGVNRIFLLHDAFYDRNGHALQPAEKEF